MMAGADIFERDRNVISASHRFLTVANIFTKAVIALFMVGFFTRIPLNFVFVFSCIKIVVALFLIYRFNKWRNRPAVFTDLDRRVAYSAGVFILVVTFLSELDNFRDRVRALITPWTQPLIQKLLPKGFDNLGVIEPDKLYFKPLSPQ